MIGHANLYEVLDRHSVVPLIEEHLNGKQKRRILIWSLVNEEA